MSDFRSRDAGDPVTLHSSLESVMRSLKGSSGRANGGIFAAWESVVGEQVAAHATPISLDSGKLVIEVDQPGWATQMRYLEADLITRLMPYAAGAALDSIEVRVAGQPRGRSQGRSR